MTRFATLNCSDAMFYGMNDVKSEQAKLQKIVKQRLKLLKQ